ncbi:hypothetical protein Tco_1077132 [Tanacetum coccineum]
MLGELWDCQFGNLTAGTSSGGGGNGLSMVELGCRVLSEAVRMAHTLMEQKIQDKAQRVAENNKRNWESNNNQSGNNNINNYRDNTRHHQHNNRRQGNARAMTTAQLNKVDMPETSPFATVVGSITPVIAR